MRACASSMLVAGISTDHQPPSWKYLNKNTLVFGNDSMTYYVYRDRSYEWRWQLQAANGRIIADSGEGYVNKSDCLSAIQLVKGSAAAPIVER